VIDFGVIRPPAKAPLESRLLVIFQGLSGVIEKHAPERVAVEGIYQAKNVRSALTLGHARGAALLAAAARDLPLAAFAPSTVKAHVSGYGLADKQQVSWMVSRLLGLPADLLPGDAADALALAICGADLMPDAGQENVPLRAR
jgi:crossover junction endodeoxyribonuclease RuvC